MPKRKLTKKVRAQSKKMPLETALLVPNDCVFEILVRLPAKSVGKFRCVSKSWLSITTHSSFVRAHTQHTSATHGQSLIIQRPGLGKRFYLASAIAPNGITICKLNMPCQNFIRASCDGLLCLWNSTILKHYIFNPLTGCSVILPTNTRLHTRFLAFYFHHSTSEYRLLELELAHYRTNMLIVGKNSRKQISCHLPAYCNHSYTVDYNGILHWLAWKQIPLSDIVYTSPPDIIMTFDKEPEVYGLLSLPPLEKLRERGSNLANFNGELGLLTSNNFGIDLWIMEKHWVKKYSVNFINAHGSFTTLEVRPGLAWLPAVTVTVGDEVIFMDINVSGTLHYLVRWNLKSGLCLVQNWRTNYPHGVTTFPYFEVLFDHNPSFSKSKFRHPCSTHAQSKRCIT